MLMKRFSFIAIFLFIMIPITIIDGLLDGIRDGGYRFFIRLTLLLIGVFVARLVPSP
ncbi:MAG: hypothetical protein ABIG71_00050 [Candidatus Uhrbacteria bacterium]